MRPTLFNNGTRDVPLDSEMSMQTVPSGMPLTNPKVGEREATTCTPQPTKELPEVDAKLTHVVAPGPSICQRAQTV
jgi:hypothetical protein